MIASWSTATRIWTSTAHLADYMYALVRTDSKLGKQQGVSMLLIDMKSPGVVARPIDLIAGKWPFLPVFFDDVRVPAKNLVGTLHGSRAVAKRLLQHERAAMSKFAELNMPGPTLLGMLKPACGDSAGRVDPVLVDKVAGLEIEAHVLRLTQQRIVEMLKARQDIFKVAATMKYQAAESAEPPQ